MQTPLRSSLCRLKPGFRRTVPKDATPLGVKLQESKSNTRRVRSECRARLRNTPTSDKTLSSAHTGLKLPPRWISCNVELVRNIEKMMPHPVFVMLDKFSRFSISKQVLDASAFDRDRASLSFILVPLRDRLLSLNSRESCNRLEINAQLGDDILGLLSKQRSVTDVLCLWMLFRTISNDS